MKDPLKDIRDSLELLSNPLIEHQKMMAALTDPMKQHREMMASLVDPMKQHREMLTSITDPMKGLRASLTFDPLKELRATLAHISEPFSEVQKMINHNMSLKYIRDIALEVEDDIQVSADGLVSLSSKQIAASELEGLAETIFQSQFFGNTNSLENSINELANEIKLLKDPLTQKIFISYIYPLLMVILAALITPVVNNKINSYIKTEKIVITKELKMTVNSEVENKQLLSSFRYVSADILNVRSSASTKSEVIGYLHFSYTVMIIEKQKNWSLIEWRNLETGARITGWVFTEK
ncbi:SH3 domain-containing protein [Pelagibaculum spongiae]|uniref:SH3b domain-containing protein n=1 Tax=Pelagibaculum spongiae TaxID=2080658 RepID=A0A2V1GXN5_9GAMM|nr:SH3 domain-containing protein [Pelagibaculum spongiae]PVZ71546.1 hypothetical protein DC094_00420 [Pelagibaculum spongiae]